jgi:hypothetical protein
MDIFISWSGKRSRAFAEALRDWLPMIINAARPFLSSSDIDKGARWSTEIAGKLEKASWHHLPHTEQYDIRMDSV